MRRALPAFALAVLAAFALGACGTEDNTVVKSSSASAMVKEGSTIFSERCSGCHTLDAAGTQGSATKIGDRERTDGPNFNTRKECKANVLYALRNGGYSGAIMPENLVVGDEAEAVAEFLQQYSGTQAKATAGSTPVSCPQ